MSGLLPQTRIPRPGKMAVIGAGAVGTCCALALQRRGLEVVLIDRSEPGSETSHGNAGVLSRSMMLPVNNPRLLPNLPRLLGNRTAQFRYSVAEVLRHPGWGLAFMRASRGTLFEETIRALDELIRLSFTEHEKLMSECGAQQRVATNGWMHLYRTPHAFAASAFARDIYARFGISTELLRGTEVQELEPHISRAYHAALWIKDTLTVNNPGALVADYARLFVQRGGVYIRQEVQQLSRSDSTWVLGGSSSEPLRVDSVVVATGPWSRSFLGMLGIKLPMAFERGYHMQYTPQPGARLGRPVLDGAAGFVLAPMTQGIRLTTGVELTRHLAPPSVAQLNLAERAAREAFPLGERLQHQAWLGSRPTLPDSRPMIGAAPGHPGMWLALGHQHIGFHTSAGTAALLADLVCGTPPSINADAFSPRRF